jgi:hypothetical protein
MDQRIMAGKSSYIAWDDTNSWHYIEVNGTVLNLTPTQYRICRAFLSASETRNGLLAGKFAILSYQSYGQLFHETKLTRRTTLIRHISHLNARIVPLGLELCSFQGGYLLLFSANKAQKMLQQR